MAKALVITEKPSVARDIAEALGGFTEHDGYWESDDYVVTFAVGHLFELLSPEEVDEKFKRWTLDVLPIIPERFEIKKKKGQSDRVRVIKKLVERDDVDRVVNACDAGREGELIFREVVKFLEVGKPIERLWLQSMTNRAIQDGFQSLIPGAEMEGLAQAAECRAYSDWLIGMNATRAITKRLKSRKEKTSWSAGRVQTPTLALLVDKEFEVLAHVPEPFHKITATFEHAGSLYEGTWFDPEFKAGDDDQRKDDRIFDAERAKAIVAAVQGQAGSAGETRKPSRESAPTLFDLTSLQREANRRFGWSARRTLGAAQRCYEGHKILTYPRTDSKCLPEDYRPTVDEILANLANPSDEVMADYAAGAQRLIDNGRENEKKIFNDAGVSDHFAVIPTGNAPTRELTGDDKRLFDLVMRRFLGAFHPPALWERVERTTEVAGERFRTRTRALMEPGWRSVLPVSEDEEQPQPLPALAPGEAEASGIAVAPGEIVLDEQETKPPPRITEARLLSLMENAGKAIEDEDLAAALQEKGLGTPATRADVIENLIAKSYVVRVGKALRPTVKGIRLIDTLKRIHIDRLASADLTGQIEQDLKKVEHGERSADDFMAEMKQYACDIVDVAKTFEYGDLYSDVPSLGACPSCGKPVIEMAWFYRCEPDPETDRTDADCPMRFWKDTSGRYLDRDAVRALIKDGKTPILDGFTARNGRTYRGTIELDTEEWKLVVQSEGWNEDGGYQLPEYEMNTEPLDTCPFGGDECQVVETPTHFLCTTQLAFENAQTAWRAAKKEAREKGEKQPTKPDKPDHAGFIFPRTVCKREITRDEAEYYLANGKTELLEDFTSRFGRPFSATLVLKETGKHGFEFPPRKRKGDDDGDAPAGTKKTSKKATKKKTTKKTRKTTKKATKKKTTRKKVAAKKVAKKAPAKKSGAKTKAATRKKAAPKASETE